MPPNDLKIVQPARYAWAMIAAIALAVASAAPIAWIDTKPRDGRTVAAIYAPWIGTDGALDRAAKAGGAILRLGLIGTIVVVHSDEPGLSHRLYRSGAWMVIDPNALGGCLTSNT